MILRPNRHRRPLPLPVHRHIFCNQTAGCTTSGWSLFQWNSENWILDQDIFFQTLRFNQALHPAQGDGHCHWALRADWRKFQWTSHEELPRKWLYLWLSQKWDRLDTPKVFDTLMPKTPIKTPFIDLKLWITLILILFITSEIWSG